MDAGDRFDPDCVRHHAVPLSLGFPDQRGKTPIVCGLNGPVRSVSVSTAYFGEYLRRAAVIGITWPVPAELDDAELERRLFTPAALDGHPERPQPVTLDNIMRTNLNANDFLFV